MKHPEFCFVDVAFGGVEKRNNLVLVNQVKPNGQPDCYRTVYRYPEAMRQHFDVAKSVGGYKGSAYADWLPIDIDHEDLSRAHDNARVLLMQIQARFDVDLAQVWCFFSGAKGFHILLPQAMFGWQPGGDVPRRFKDMALVLADGLEIDTTIYDKVRLFRLSNTRHGKSGLFKIPLYAKEVLNESTDYERELAKEPRQGVTWAEAELNEALQGLWVSTAQGEKAESRNVAVKADKWAKPCIAKMLEGGLREGNRQAIAFRLAVHFRKQGMGGPMILAALREWNKTNVEQLEDKELVHAVDQAVSSDYDHGCNDALLQKFCRLPCYYKTTAEEAEPAKIHIIDILEAQQRYEEYVSLLRKAKVTLQIPVLDNAMRGIAPGETCWIMARAGVGKTAFLLNILGSNSVEGVDSLFCTLEQPVAQIYERTVQITEHATGRDVEQLFIKTVISREAGQGESEQYHLWARRVAHHFRHVYMVDKDSLDIDGIETAVLQYEARLGHKPRILAIDYLGRLDGGFGNAYEQTSRLAKQVKSIAKKMNLTVLVIHQVSREGGDGTQEVTLNMGRDSGQVEEAADFVIGLWRPEMREAAKEERSEERIKVALLKCRKGALVRTEINFKKSFLIFESR